jgi:hypothetical protein
VSIFIAFTTCIAWLFLFWKLGVTNPGLYWLPFANVSQLLIAKYVEYDANTLLKSADSLENFKYDFKKV